MKKTMVFLTALALAASWLDSAGRASEIYSDSPYAAQIGMDSFNLSVAKRLESLRLGVLNLNAASAPLFSSDAALAAPSSRGAGVKSSAGRRYLDCVYNNGFTVWGDFYQTWAKQSTNGGTGYEYRASAPAAGLDWSTDNFTFGLATTYNWGRLKSRDGDERLNARAWDTTAYGQYNTDRFYVAAELSYGYNRYKGRGGSGYPADIGSVSYHSNSFNGGAEFGLKFNFHDFLVTPHGGMRLFTDRRGPVFPVGRKGYYAWETPLGLNLAYAIRAGGALIVPKVQAAWIPELARRRSDWGEFNAPRRARNGFMVGAGLEAKITKQLSGHIDYNANFRNHAYEHHWNVGVGFTF